jgi:alpha-tubulin suppressor-like RCC1 family protein
LKETIDTKLGVWGSNFYGQLAVDSENEREITMPKLLSFEIDIREISCGF